MPTFEVDDQACFNAKVLRAGNEAFGAWCRAGSWSMANLTDGFVTRDVTRLIAGDDVWYLLRDCGLPGAGLVEEADGGWQIHDWQHWQRTADEIRKHREQQANRQKNRRALLRSQKPVTRDIPRDVPCDVPRVSQGESRPPNPHPNPSSDLLSEIRQRLPPPPDDLGGKENTTPPKPLALVPDTTPDEPKRKTKQLALKRPPAPKQLTWKLWRGMYANSRRGYGKFVENPAAGGAINTLAERAQSEALSELSDRGLPAEGVEALTKELLEHWFASYLRDAGHNDFLVTKRHAIEYLLKSLSEYGLPKTWGKAAQRLAREALAGIGADHG